MFNCVIVIWECKDTKKEGIGKWGRIRRWDDRIPTLPGMTEFRLCLLLTESEFCHPTEFYHPERWADLELYSPKNNFVPFHSHQFSTNPTDTGFSIV